MTLRVEWVVRILGSHRVREALTYGLIAGLAGAAIALLLPPRYTAHAKLALNTTQQTAIGSSLLGLAQQFGLGSPSGQFSPEFIRALLGSEDLLEAVVVTQFPRAAYEGLDHPGCTSEGETCDLLQIWAVGGDNPRDSLERAARILRNGMSAGVDPRSGILGVSVQAGSPHLALAVLHRVIGVLDSSYVGLQRNLAYDQFEFLRPRVDSAKADLRVAEEALARFDAENRVVQSSPVLLRTRTRLQRDVTLAEGSYVQLTEVLAQVYLAAANNVSSIRTVDAPALPGRRSAPKRRVIVLIAVGFGLLLWFAQGYGALFYQAALDGLGITGDGNRNSPAPGGSRQDSSA
jgi:uncharacterized protein involved in exopolysaccharide biosynthesis